MSTPTEAPRQPHGGDPRGPARFGRTRAFIIARLDPTTHLGLQLTVALTVATAGIWVFSAVLDAVLDNATMVRWDVATDAWIHQRVTHTGCRIALIVTQWGSPLTITVLGVGVAAVLWSLRSRLLFTCWVAALAGGGLLDYVLKVVIKRSRPEYHPGYDLRHSYSFPSGHAMGSTVGYAMLAYVLLLIWPPAWRQRRLIVGAAGTIVLLVGSSRIYLGVHYPSDVLGGFVGGAAWAAVCIAGARIALYRMSRGQ